MVSVSVTSFAACTSYGASTLNGIEQTKEIPQRSSLTGVAPMQPRPKMRFAIQTQRVLRTARTTGYSVSGLYKVHRQGLPKERGVAWTHSHLLTSRNTSVGPLKRYTGSLPCHRLRLRFSVTCSLTSLTCSRPSPTSCTLLSCRNQLDKSLQKSITTYCLSGLIPAPSK